MKKAITLFLALTLALMMALPVMAEETGNGSITVNNAVKGQQYSIYRILDLESYEDDAYAYKPNNAWKDFIESTEIKDVYLTINDDGYVTWVGEETDTRIIAFAALAKTYAADNGITAIASQTAASDTVTFTNLDLGYYLVDSTLGALCALDTTSPTVTVNEKNTPPTNEKQVQEDSTSQFVKENDADIGQTVTFQSTITVYANNQNYVFHDQMSEGLTYSGVEKITLNGEEVAVENNYSVETTDLTDGCTFEVEFTEEFCSDLESTDKIVITYTATLNDKAVVGPDGNTNKSWLKYGATGSTSTTPPSITTTYTWDLDVLKYANGDETKVLAGVKFVLLNSDKSKAATVVNGKVTGWVAVPTGDETWPANTVLTTDEDGKISIDGLDADTYYLREIETLPGYNKLANDVKVEITGATRGEDDKLTYTTVKVKVNNNSGVEMPSTGGIGTTIFYVTGGLLVAVAVVLLVTKKKMSATK